jgi:hypothetical protein
MLPVAAWAPLHAPLAVQEAALVELQVNVAVLPLAIEPGTALRDAVGTGGGAEEWPPPHAASGSNRIGSK